MKRNLVTFFCNKHYVYYKTTLQKLQSKNEANLLDVNLFLFLENSLQDYKTLPKLKAEHALEVSNRKYKMSLCLFHN